KGSDTMSEHLKEMEKRLIECLSLEMPPIAVGFAESSSTNLTRRKGRVAAGCQFWEYAADEPFETSPDDHANCVIGCHTHNLPMTEYDRSELGQALRVFAGLGYVRDQDVALIPVLRER